MRTTSRPLATMLVLVGAMTLFAGCGDEGAHLPAGMNGSSASYTGETTGVSALDDVLGGDPGPQTAGVSTMVDDPVLAGYDGVDGIDGAGLDDPYTQAANDWNETEGSLGALDETDLDDFGDDDFLPVGYGSGYGNDDFGGYGYGGNVLGAAAYGGFGNAGFQDVGFSDPGFEDPGFTDAGFEDPGFDAGFEDPGFVDTGFDPGVGMDAGFVDPGFDAGMVDVGFDAGAGMDVGMDMGSGIEGMVF